MSIYMYPNWWDFKLCIFLIYVSGSLWSGFYFVLEIKTFGLVLEFEMWPCGNKLNIDLEHRSVG